MSPTRRDGAAPAPRGGARPALRPYDDSLRDELVAAATAALTDGGPAALSVRALARDAGTSTQAVYSLFGGKEGLLDAVLAEGFAQLGIALASVAPDPDPLRALADLGRAYRAWAHESPSLYVAMFAPRGRGIDVGGLRGGRDGSRVRAQEPSAVLAAAIDGMLGPIREQAVRVVEQDRVHDPSSARARTRAEAIAHAGWAGVHGWVQLEQLRLRPLEQLRLRPGSGDGTAPAEAGGASPEAGERAFEAYLRALVTAAGTGIG